MTRPLNRGTERTRIQPNSSQGEKRAVEAIGKQTGAVREFTDRTRVQTNPTRSQAWIGQEHWIPKKLLKCHEMVNTPCCRSNPPKLHHVCELHVDKSHSKNNIWPLIPLDSVCPGCAQWSTDVPSASLEVAVSQFECVVCIIPVALTEYFDSPWLDLVDLQLWMFCRKEKHPWFQTTCLSVAADTVCFDWLAYVHMWGSHGF